MTVIRSDEGVRNFVEDSVSDFWFGVQEGEFLAQRDRAKSIREN
jgi:hypothetical protein